MFTRSSDQGNDTQPSIPANNIRSGQVMSSDGKSTASVIGRDLTIIGSGLRIVSQGKIIIEGHIVGDVLAEEILVGEDAVVSGLMNARAIVVRGTASGTLKADEISLAATASVNGEVNHRSLAIAQGAMFEGKSVHDKGTSTLQPDLQSAATQIP